MSRRDILHRLAGIAILFGAGVSMLLYRKIRLDGAGGPVTEPEAALGLLTFTLACLGMMLLIGGARLRDGWRRRRERAIRRRERRAARRYPAPDDEENRRLRAAAANSMAFKGRAALATFLVMQERQAPISRTSAKTSQKYEPGASK